MFVPPFLGLRGRPFLMDLTGSWELVEWTASSDSEVLHPAGADAVGRLIYSPDFFMSAFLARADGHSDALAYSGAWERLGSDEVVHRVTLSTRASFVGVDLMRSVAWEGSDLVLATAVRDGWVNRLRWRRAAS